MSLRLRWITQDYRSIETGSSTSNQMWIFLTDGQLARSTGGTFNPFPEINQNSINQRINVLKRQHEREIEIEINGKAFNQSCENAKGILVEVRRFRRRERHLWAPWAGHRLASSRRRPHPLATARSTPMAGSAPSRDPPAGGGAAGGPILRLWPPGSVYSGTQRPVSTAIPPKMLKCIAINAAMAR